MNIKTNCFINQFQIVFLFTSLNILSNFNLTIQYKKNTEPFYPLLILPEPFLLKVMQFALIKEWKNLKWRVNRCILYTSFFLQ